MKKILLMFGAIALSSGLALAQCPQGVAFATGTAPTPGATSTITTCNFAGEYNTVNGVVSGDDYTVASSLGDYFTVYDQSLTVVAFGPGPLSFTAASSGTFYTQVNTDAACGTQNSCRTVTWENTSPLPPCPIEASPWLDDVESIPATTSLGPVNCWTTSAATGYDWNVTGTGTTPSSFTGALAANSGNNFFYTEASGAGVGVTAELVTPEVDLTGMTLPQFSFYYHMVGGQMGTLDAEISDDGGLTWTNLTTLAGQQQSAQADAFLLSESVLVGYSGVVQFRFTATANGGFEGDICIDDIAISEAPTCPNPTNLALNASDLTSATFSWTPGFSETQWALEYGAPGFTPGTGTSSLTTNNILEVITGLPSNQFFEIYVRAACSLGDTSGYVGPLSFNTFNQGLFMDADNACGPGFNDISTTGALNTLGDDGEVGTTMPFTLLYQGTPYADMTIGSNGALVFGTTTAQVGFTNQAMAGAADGLYPFWDDLGPENSPSDGVYFETIGTAPNQQFIVQWNKPHLGGNGQAYIFQAVIDEASNEIYYLYNVVSVGDGFNDYGGSATVGAAGPNQDIELSFNNQQYLTDNSCAHFFYTDCPNPTNFTATYVNPADAGITWDAGLGAETNWTIIYGPCGFDPALTGTTITSGTNVAILSGLTDITCYEVYILADCDPGVTQSVGGLFGTFTTPPNCSDVTGLSAGTAVDSLFTAWSWVESSGVGTYPSTGFNVQYGPTGFNLYSGTTVAADNNFTDTTFDASFLAGGVYEVYVQAVCGTDTSNFIGPVSFTMPLTNDSTCLAETLPVDGVAYSFDNTGATTQVNEINVAPPTTGYNTTDGWGDANLTFTTWFTFDAPASGSIYVSGTDAGFDGQIAIYEATDCADFSTYTLVAANDDALDFSSPAPDFSLCGLTPGNTYYLMHDSWSTFTTGVYSISLREIVVNSGATTGLIEICTGDTVNLNDGMSGQDAGGVWLETIPTANFADPIFPSAGLAYQVFDFQYVVTDGCAADTAIQQVEIFAPSSAGDDGTITVCQNQPLDLVNGLNGTVDLGGDWYDPSNNPTSSSITASGIPGSFNYDYITSNGVCPADTSNVEVIVSPSCDHLDVQELYFGDMSVFPNPSNGIVNITNFGSAEVFSYEVTDVKGSVIGGASSAINGSTSTEIDLGGLETGIYLIEVYNDSARKTFRIVLQ
ncbi:MAG: T9SS type A sorting domain-containing protein [Crocinitomicaceae bacterium]|nr:T9SS type A sorting domain-containing protein [Crocinitomicaceae bacterium]